MLGAKSSTTATVTRAFQVAREELSSLHPRLWLAQIVSAALPPYVGARLRTSLLRFAGLSIGKGTIVGGRVWIGGGSRPAGRITIGDDCFVNDGVRLDASAPITIGDHVAIGHSVTVVTSSHEIGDHRRRSMALTAEPVAIGSASWIGARAMILPGVTIGDGAIVAAGAVVDRSVPPGALVGGVPARPIRDLDSDAGGSRPASAPGEGGEVSGVAGDVGAPTHPRLTRRGQMGRSAGVGQ